MRLPCLILALVACTGVIHAQEPTNADEAKAQAAQALKDERKAALERKYQALVATLPPEEQAWEKVLQQCLGEGFYLPAHKADKVAGKSTAWDFVRDDPKLPRVLLIGDSVSRGYTQPTRKALAGVANVHRAPANCGPTARGLENLATWLGDGNWQVIHFNFGIHDRATPLKDYADRLEKIVGMLEKTGATLIWATTTPIPDEPSKGYQASAIVDHNAVAAKIMAEHHIAVDDLYGAMLPQVDTLRRPADVHFTEAGYEFLGKQVAGSLTTVLASLPHP